MKLTRNDFVKFSLEAIMVAFGVILGLLVSEWDSNRKTNQNAENAIVHIIAELNQNITQLETAIKYHQKIGIEYDSVAKLLQPEDMELTYYNNTKFKQNELPSWSGIKTIKPESIIYESAQLNGIFQEFNIETLLLIANAYKHLEVYSEFSKAPLNKFLAINSESKLVDICIILELIKTDILNTEKSLKNDLVVTVEKLKEIEKNNSFKK